MTYDQWKTTDPRDYEPEPEEAPSELEDCFEKIRELQDDAKADAAIAAKRIAELSAALHVCLDYLKDKYDTIDGMNGPLPNEEMRLGTMVDETLHGIQF